MRIFFVTISGRPFSVEVDISCTVDQLKDQIYGQEGCDGDANVSTLYSDFISVSRKTG
jgi:hypothetical protein